MPLSVPLAPETEARLKAKAAAGLDVEIFAARTLERVASRPPLDEVLAPLRAEFEASGMSEEQLGELLEQAKHDDRDAPPIWVAIAPSLVSSSAQLTLLG